MKCQECGMELKPNKELWKDILSKMKELLGYNYEPSGYTCFDSGKGCGTCYDDDFKIQKIRMGWLK